MATMSGGSGLPDWIQQIQKRNQNFGGGGSSLEQYFQQMMSGGLGKYGDMLNRQGEGAIGDRVRTGTQDLQEQFASKGNVSARAMNKGFSDMSSSGANALQNLYVGTEGLNMQARQQGAEGMMGLEQFKIQREKLAEMKRQFDESQPGLWDDLMGLAGGFMQGGGIGDIAKLSDRKLKTNIKKLSTIKGINIYSFNYIDEKFGKGTYIGVMADEVEHLNAVIETPYGKAVNYNIINNYLR